MPAAMSKPRFILGSDNLRVFHNLAVCFANVLMVVAMIMGSL